jgi:hypothetical protein
MEWIKAKEKGLDMSYKARIKRAVEQGYTLNLHDLYLEKADEQGRDFTGRSGGDSATKGTDTTGNGGRTGANTNSLQQPYHGSADGIERFVAGHEGRKNSGWLGEGIYLTDQPEIAWLF